MSWLGALNFLLLQWFGVHLARTTRSLTDVTGACCARGSIVRVADTRWRVIAIVDSGTVVMRRYHVMRWIWPLTGWWSPYKWIVRPA